MNFVMIYGPTAAGKLSVAKELVGITGYRLLDNHTILNAIAALFPFEDPALNKIRMRLGRKYRLEMFEEAAKAGVNVITTLVVRGPDSFAFMREVKAAVETHGGQVLIVQLHPTVAAIMDRVESASRKGVKVATRDHLRRDLAGRPMQFDTFSDTDHLMIDNTHLGPKEVALQISSCYKLGLES